jgi:hypothetical protein
MIGNVKKSVCTFVSMVLALASLSAAETDANVNGTVDLLAPISLTNQVADCLDFGSIAKGTSLTYITIPATASPVPSYSGGDASVVSSSTPRAAMFTVGGAVNKTYSISLPTTSTLSFGSNVLNLSAFTCSNSTGGSAIISAFNNDFYVGATLELPSTTLSGQYIGTFSVTVDYN